MQSLENFIRNLFLKLIKQKSHNYNPKKALDIPNTEYSKNKINGMMINRNKILADFFIKRSPAC